MENYRPSSPTREFDSPDRMHQANPGQLAGLESVSNVTPLSRLSPIDNVNYNLPKSQKATSENGFPPQFQHIQESKTAKEVVFADIEEQTAQMKHSQIAEWDNPPQYERSYHRQSFNVTMVEGAAILEGKKTIEVSALMSTPLADRRLSSSTAVSATVASLASRSLVRHESEDVPEADGNKSNLKQEDDKSELPCTMAYAGGLPSFSCSPYILSSGIEPCARKSIPVVQPSTQSSFSARPLNEMRNKEHMVLPNSGIPNDKMEVSEGMPMKPVTVPGDSAVQKCSVDHSQSVTSDLNSTFNHAFLSPSSMVTVSQTPNGRNSAISPDCKEGKGLLGFGGGNQDFQNDLPLFALDQKGYGKKKWSSNARQSSDSGGDGTPQKRVLLRESSSLSTKSFKSTASIPIKEENDLPKEKSVSNLPIGAKSTSSAEAVSTHKSYTHFSRDEAVMGDVSQSFGAYAAVQSLGGKISSNVLAQDQGAISSYSYVTENFPQRNSKFSPPLPIPVNTSNTLNTEDNDISGGALPSPAGSLSSVSRSGSPASSVASNASPQRLAVAQRGYEEFQTRRKKASSIWIPKPTRHPPLIDLSSTILESMLGKKAAIKYWKVVVANKRIIRGFPLLVFVGLVVHAFCLLLPTGSKTGRSASWLATCCLLPPFLHAFLNLNPTIVSHMPYRFRFWLLTGSLLLMTVMTMILTGFERGNAFIMLWIACQLVIVMDGFHPAVQRGSVPLLLCGLGALLYLCLVVTLGLIPLSSTAVGDTEETMWTIGSRVFSAEDLILNSGIVLIICLVQLIYRGFMLRSGTREALFRDHLICQFFTIGVYLSHAKLEDKTATETEQKKTERTFFSESITMPSSRDPRSEGHTETTTLRQNGCNEPKIAGSSSIVDIVENLLKHKEIKSPNSISQQSVYPPLSPLQLPRTADAIGSSIEYTNSSPLHSPSSVRTSVTIVRVVEQKSGEKDADEKEAEEEEAEAALEAAIEARAEEEEAAKAQELHGAEDVDKTDLDSDESGSNENDEDDDSSYSSPSLSTSSFSSQTSSSWNWANKGISFISRAAPLKKDLGRQIVCTLAAARKWKSSSNNPKSSKAPLTLSPVSSVLNFTGSSSATLQGSSTDSKTMTSVTLPDMTSAKQSRRDGDNNHSKTTSEFLQQQNGENADMAGRHMNDSSGSVLPRISPTPGIAAARVQLSLGRDGVGTVSQHQTSTALKQTAQDIVDVSRGEENGGSERCEVQQISKSESLRSISSRQTNISLAYSVAFPSSTSQFSANSAATSISIGSLSASQITARSIRSIEPFSSGQSSASQLPSSLPDTGRESVSSGNLLDSVVRHSVINLSQYGPDLSAGLQPYLSSAGDDSSQARQCGNISARSQQSSRSGKSNSSSHIFVVPAIGSKIPSNRSNRSNSESSRGSESKSFRAKSSRIAPLFSATSGEVLSDDPSRGSQNTISRSLGPGSVFQTSTSPSGTSRLGRIFSAMIMETVPEAPNEAGINRDSGVSQISIPRPVVNMLPAISPNSAMDAISQREGGPEEPSTKRLEVTGPRLSAMLPSMVATAVAKLHQQREKKAAAKQKLQPICFATIHTLSFVPDGLVDDTNIVANLLFGKERAERWGLLLLIATDNWTTNISERWTKFCGFWQLLCSNFCAIDQTRRRRLQALVVRTVRRRVFFWKKESDSDWDCESNAEETQIGDVWRRRKRLSARAIKSKRKGSKRGASSRRITNNHSTTIAAILPVELAENKKQTAKVDNLNIAFEKPKSAESFRLPGKPDRRDWWLVTLWLKKVKERSTTVLSASSTDSLSLSSRRQVLRIFRQLLSICILLSSVLTLICFSLLTFSNIEVLPTAASNAPADSLSETKLLHSTEVIVSVLATQQANSPCVGCSRPPCAEAAHDGRNGPEYEHNCLTTISQGKEQAMARIQTFPRFTSHDTEAQLSASDDHASSPVSGVVSITTISRILGPISAAGMTLGVLWILIFSNVALLKELLMSLDVLLRSSQETIFAWVLCDIFGYDLRCFAVVTLWLQFHLCLLLDSILPSAAQLYAVPPRRTLALIMMPMQLVCHLLVVFALYFGTIENIRARSFGQIHRNSVSSISGFAFQDAALSLPSSPATSSPPAHYILDSVNVAQSRGCTLALLTVPVLYHVIKHPRRLWFIHGFVSYPQREEGFPSGPRSQSAVEPLSNTDDRQDTLTTARSEVEMLDLPRNRPRDKKVNEEEVDQQKTSVAQDRAFHSPRSAAQGTNATARDSRASSLFAILPRKKFSQGSSPSRKRDLYSYFRWTRKKIDP